MEFPLRLEGSGQQGILSQSCYQLLQSKLTGKRVPDLKFQGIFNSFLPKVRTSLTIHSLSDSFTDCSLFFLLLRLLGEDSLSASKSVDCIASKEFFVKFISYVQATPLNLSKKHAQVDHFWANFDSISAVIPFLPPTGISSENRTISSNSRVAQISGCSHLAKVTCTICNS